jgi:putative AdoMet-dependent methyltransferase
MADRHDSTRLSIDSVTTMRSRHIERFNHDAEAPGYDADVRNEADPIRAGYSALLDWVVASAAAGPSETVTDLGAGTGNLAARLGPVGRLVCVDASTKMLDLARAKLPSATEYVVADLLEYAGDGERDLDVVVSTYAIHHLTGDEKSVLFRALAGRLRSGGRFVAGDLMLASPEAAEDLRAEIGADVLDELLAEEFPWYVDAATDSLAAAGFADITWRRFSALSWGVSARR